MRGMLKKTLISIPIFILVATIVVFFSFEVFRTDGLLFKPLFGMGQVLRAVKCRIYVDEVFAPKAKMFKMDRLVDGSSVDMLILWLPTDKKPYLRDILIIDRKNNTVGLPNSDDASYGLYLNCYLFQARGADWFVPFSDRGEKGWCFNPRLKIGKGVISFSLPGEELFSYRTIRIEFSAKV